MMKQRQNSRYHHTSYRKLDKGKESDSGGEETELLEKTRQKRKEIPTVEKDLEEGDTLQSLAIRYHCTISDLKRLNNIDKENEIFARRTIKVPFRPFSMALAGVHVSGRTSPDAAGNGPPLSNLIDIDSLGSKLSNGSLNGTKNELNDIIFHSQMIQRECERVVESVSERGAGDEDEEVRLLPSKGRGAAETDPVVSSLSCSGADGDISWIGLIICIVILIFALPLIYVFYIAEHIDKYRNHSS